MFNLSFITPPARPIVEVAASVYYLHTQPSFIGLIAHGSAVKGGFIPGCSDIDLQLYLEDTAFTNVGQLPLSLCVNIHRDLARIDPSPFQYIQCMAHGTKLPDDHVGPIPGAYTIVAGRLPVPVATGQKLRESAHRALANLNPALPYVINGLLDHGETRLQRHIRWLCTDVWPTLYHVLSLQQDDPIHIWCLPKDAAITLLPTNAATGQTIRAFHQAALAYYPTQNVLEHAFAVIEHGLAFLSAAKAWYNESIDHPSSTP